MNLREKAVYVNNMPFEMFEALMKDQKEVKKSIKRSDEIMKVANNQRPSDTRGFTTATLNLDYLMTCIERETTLIAKMVSLNILFANPTDNPEYFKEICEIFTTTAKDGSKIIDYKQIANIYKTTVDNVQSNILLTNYVEQLKKAKTITK